MATHTTKTCDKAYEFWTKYITSDDIGRLKLAMKLAETVISCHDIPDYNLRLHCLATYMKSYFDDLIESLNIDIVREEGVKRALRVMDEISRKSKPEKPLADVIRKFRDSRLRLVDGAGGD